MFKKQRELAVKENDLTRVLGIISSKIGFREIRVRANDDIGQRWCLIFSANETDYVAVIDELNKNGQINLISTDIGVEMVFVRKPS